MKKWVQTAFFWWLLMVIVVFVPFIFLVGFGVSDDLFFVKNISSDFINDLSYSLSRSGHVSRPIYGIVQTISLHLFGDNYLYYNLSRLVIWFLIIYKCNIIFHSFFSKQSIWVLVFFVSFPVFASSHLYNFFQMGYLISLLFFLLALNALKDDTGGFTKKINLNYLTFGLLALFSCEIVFPLFIFPILYNHWSKLSGIFTSRLTYVTALIVIIPIFFKFLIGPLYQIEAPIYGFNPSLNSILQSTYYFVVILFEIPLMLIEVIPFFTSEPVLWSSFLVIPLFYVVNRDNEFEYNCKLFYTVMVTLSCCSLIFFLSNYPAVSFGLYNKMLLPSHFLYALLLAILCLRIIRTKFFFIGYIIGVLWFASMQMQNLNATRSWELRKDKLNYYVSILNNEKKHNNYLFIEAPYFLPTNYNNEHVFALNDDFQSGLLLYGMKVSYKEVYPFCSQMLSNEQYFKNHNINKIIRENKLTRFDVLLSNGRIKRNQTINSLSNLSLSSQAECLRSRIRSCFIRKMSVLR